MKRETINYAVAGAFVVAIAVGLLATIYALMGRSGPVDAYHVHFSNVSGMKFGTLVRYEGYPVGKVQGINPEHSDQGVRFRVDFSVSRGWPIRTGSVARVITSGLISAVAIDIAAGSEDGTMAPGSELEGVARVDMFTALNEAANDFRSLSQDSLKPLAQTLNRELTGLLRDLRLITTESLKPLVETVGAQINDPALFQDLRTLTRQLSSVSGSLDRFLNDGALGDASETLHNLSVLSAEVAVTNRRLADLLSDDNRVRVASTLANLDGLAEESRETNLRMQAFLSPRNEQAVAQAVGELGSTAATIAREVTRLSGLFDAKQADQLQRTLASIDRLSSDLAASGGAVRRLLGEDNQKHIAAALHNIEALSTELRVSNQRVQSLLDEDNRASVKVALRRIGDVAQGIGSVVDVVEEVFNPRNGAQISQILHNVELVSRDVGALVRNLGDTRLRLQGLIEQVETVLGDNEVNLTAGMKDFRHALGVLSSHVDTITYHLEGSSRNMHEFTRQIRENPGLLISSSPQRDQGADAGNATQ